MKIKIDWFCDGYRALPTSFEVGSTRICPHFLYYDEMYGWLAERDIIEQPKFKDGEVYEQEHNVPDHLAIEIKLRWSGMEDHVDDPDG